MANRSNVEDKIIELVSSSHGSMTNALQFYARRMREDATEIDKKYPAVAGVARESADRADQVSEALADLIDQLDSGEG